jgi:hypothetical protein
VSAAVSRRVCRPIGTPGITEESAEAGHGIESVRDQQVDAGCGERNRALLVPVGATVRRCMHDGPACASRALPVQEQPVGLIGESDRTHLLVEAQLVPA